MFEARARTAADHQRFGGTVAGVGRSALFLAVSLMAFALMVLAWGSPASAVPASDRVFTLDQPDGDGFAARLYGDEWNHGYETKSGYTVVRAPRSEEWVYATLEGGDLEPSSRVAGEEAPPAEADEHLRADVEEPEVDYPDTRTSSSESLSESGEGKMGTLASTGDHNSLVLLTRFTDQAPSTTPAQWNSKFFGATNSVRDYYQEASYGKLNINPASESSGTVNDGVVGWLSMPYVHPDTGNPNNPPDVTPNMKLTADALKAADPYVNYGFYDDDGNGILSSEELHVTVVAAGQEGACCNNLGKSIWGHMSVVSWDMVPTLDGVMVGGPGPDNGYTQFGEMHDTNQASIGVMVHEMGHDLGLPDLYDVDDSSIGVGAWSVMGGGSWGALPGQQYGSLPPLPDAWSRSFEGWLTPQRVEGNVQVPQASTSDTVYQMLHNPAGVDWEMIKRSGTGEYFLIENRQLTGYDASLPGCGLLVWHIDETRSPHNEETNSDETRRLVDLEAADGDDGDGYSKTDPFVGGAGTATFDGTTDPSSALYGGAPSGASMSTSGGCSQSMSASIVDPRAAEAVGSDAFASAPELTLTNNGVSAGGNNATATKEVGEPNHANNAGGKSLWYRWTAPENGRLTVDTRSSKTTSGAMFDTTLGMYTGTAVNGLSPVVPGNDDEKDDEGYGELTTSRLGSVPVTAGTTYRIAVDGRRNDSGVVGTGNVSLNLSFAPVADPFGPTVGITSPADNSEIKGANVAFSADATDNVGVDRVEFYVDYDKFGTDTTGEGTDGKSYSVNWDSTLVGDGWHDFYVVAYDVSGHKTQTEIRRAYVDNSLPVPPTVLSSAPTPGKTGVSRKGNAKVNFSEMMDLGTLNKYGVGIVREGTTTRLSAKITSSADRKSVILNPYGTTTKVLAARAWYRVLLSKDAVNGLRDADEGELLQSGGAYQTTPDGKHVYFRFQTAR